MNHFIKSILTPVYRARERDLRVQVRVLVVLALFLLGVALYATWGAVRNAERFHDLLNLIQLQGLSL